MPINHTALVTGASRGLGFALASQLAEAGWNLIIDARDADALHRAADALRTAGSAACRAQPVGDGHRITVEPIAGDITDAAHRIALVRAAQAHGRLDLLINNAGTLGPSPLPSVAEFDLAALRDTFEVNTIGPLALTQLALPQLLASRGAVIDITSDAAVEGYPGWGGYGASKAATEQLRRVLAAEVADLPVWWIDPGDLRTRMHQDAFPGEDISDRPLPESVAPGLLGLLAQRPPSGRYRLADFSTPGAAASATTSVDDPAAPIRLWLTSEVTSFAPVAAFYRDALGLPEIDGWSIDDEAGAVFALGPDSRIEIEQPGSFASTTGVRAAIEYPDPGALTAAHARLVAYGADASSPVTHHRGHCGFTVTDPAGVEIYLWTEKGATA